MLNVKNDKIGILKEVEKIIVNCKIKDSNDIEIEDYMLWWNKDK